MQQPQLTPEQADVVRKSEHFQSLRENEGFKILVEEAKRAVVAHWQSLLTISPQELASTQGFIAGANFMLEYVDESIRNARQILDDYHAAQARSFEETRTRFTRFQSATAERRVGVGADL